MDSVDPELIQVEIPKQEESLMIRFAGMSFYRFKLSSLKLKQKG